MSGGKSQKMTHGTQGIQMDHYLFQQLNSLKPEYKVEENIITIKLTFEPNSHKIHTLGNLITQDMNANETKKIAQAGYYIQHPSVPTLFIKINTLPENKDSPSTLFLNSLNRMIVEWKKLLKQATPELDRPKPQWTENPLLKKEYEKQSQPNQSSILPTN